LGNAHRCGIQNDRIVRAGELIRDLILAAESAYFLLAFVNIGLVPDGGSSLFLPTRIGMARATELSMLGERLSAAQATLVARWRRA